MDECLIICLWVEDPVWDCCYAWITQHSGFWGWGWWYYLRLRTKVIGSNSLRSKWSFGFPELHIQIIVPVLRITLLRCKKFKTGAFIQEVCVSFRHDYYLWGHLTQEESASPFHRSQGGRLRIPPLGEIKGTESKFRKHVLLKGCCGWKCNLAVNPWKSIYLAMRSCGWC